MLNRNLISLLIALGAALVFVPMLGWVELFDWDEVNFAEAAREMLLTGQWTYVQIDFQPFWEKPPLFIWMQALSMKLFGVSAFAARLPNAVAGILTLVLLFRIGSRVVDTRFGLLWTMAFAGSMLPGFYFRSGIIDPWFNLFIFLGVHQLAMGSVVFPMARWRIVVAATFFGLAVLTKGPVGVGVPGIVLVLFGLWHWKEVRIRLTDPLLFLVPVVVVGFSWFIAEALRGHGHVVQDFIAYNIRLATTSEAGHGQPFYYHAVVLLVGCFPISIFFLLGMRTSPDITAHQRYYRWMQLLFWVVLIVFSVVKTKIVHYSSLTYFPMTFLAAYHLQGLLDGKWRLRTGHVVALGLLAALLGTAFTLAGMFNTLRPALMPLLRSDAFASAMFAHDVAESWWHPLIGLGFLIGIGSALYLLRKGRARVGLPVMFLTTGLTVWAVGIVVAPKVIHYTQHDLMQFYDQKRVERCYLQPMHFHTYAHLYYGQKQPPEDTLSRDLAWMVNGPVDRPVYFIVRNTDIDQVHRWFAHIQVTDQRGPFVIMQRTDEGYTTMMNALKAQ